MQQISKNISYKEATHSITALRYGIKNEPDLNQLANIKRLAEKVLEPLRKGLGNRPVYYNSIFRCKELNSIIGGAPDSQHMALRLAAAADIDNDGREDCPTNAEIFNYIRDYLDFDQLIWEYGDAKQPAWVHVSYTHCKNRSQVLICVEGRYFPYHPY